MARGAVAASLAVLGVGACWYTESDHTKAAIASRGGPPPTTRVETGTVTDPVQQLENVPAHSPDNALSGVIENPSTFATLPATTASLSPDLSIATFSSPHVARAHPWADLVYNSSAHVFYRKQDGFVTIINPLTNLAISDAVIPKDQFQSIQPSQKNPFDIAWTDKEGNSHELNLAIIPDNLEHRGSKVAIPEASLENKFKEIKMYPHLGGVLIGTTGASSWLLDAQGNKISEQSFQSIRPSLNQETSEITFYGRNGASAETIIAVIGL